MSDPTPQDQKRAQAACDCAECQGLPPIDGQDCAEDRIATALAEQRQRIEDAVNDLAEKRSGFTRAKVIVAIRSADCEHCDNGVIHNAWGEDGVDMPCTYCQSGAGA